MRNATLNPSGPAVDGRHKAAYPDEACMDGRHKAGHEAKAKDPS
jgi:hypothetical protein